MHVFFIFARSFFYTFCTIALYKITWRFVFFVYATGKLRKRRDTVGDFIFPITVRLGLQDSSLPPTPSPKFPFPLTDSIANYVLNYLISGVALFMLGSSTNSLSVRCVVVV